MLPGAGLKARLFLPNALAQVGLEEKSCRMNPC